MAQQILDLGDAPNDQGGDPLREGGEKINENFSELYQAISAFNNALATLDQNDIAGLIDALGGKVSRSGDSMSGILNMGNARIESLGAPDSSDDATNKAYVDGLLSSAGDNIATKAPINSPNLTGTPTTPTAATATSNTQIANTAFVHAVVDALVNGSPQQLDTIRELAAALGDDANFAATVTAALAGKATAAQGAKADTALQPGTPISADTLVDGMANVAMTLDERARIRPIQKNAVETGFLNRFRIGNRLYATWDAALGFYFRKVRLPASGTVDDLPGLKLSERLMSSPVSTYVRRSSGETMGPLSTLRLKIGNRVFATLDAVNGFFPRKITLPLTSKIEDGSGLISRLVGANTGDKLKALGAEQGGTNMLRFRIGNRSYGTLTPSLGFYFRKLIVPASTKVDDDLTSTLVSRLLAGGIGVMLKRLPVEAGGVLRFRWGNRLLGYWSAKDGMVFTRMLIPSNAKMADQPTVTLADRLGGSQLPYVDGASYTALSVTDSVTGKKVLRSVRKSDARQFNALTSSSYNAIAQSITTDNRIVFWDDQNNRHSWIPAEGGTKYRAFGDTAIIDAWGDSLTAGAGSSGTAAGQGAYPKQLADRFAAAGLSITVNNRGVGGQTSSQIVARQGGAPALLTVSGNQIAASGSTTVTSYSVSPSNSQGPSGGIAATLAGVPGTLVTTFDPTTFAVTSMVFNRTTPGSVVACPPNTPLIPDLGVLTQERVNLIKVGRNDGSTSGATTLARVASAWSYIKSIYRKGLILAIEVSSTEIGSSTQTNILATNSNLASIYGDDFVDVNAVPTTEEMATLGFVPDSYGVYPNYRTDAADLNGRASGGFAFTAAPASGDTVTINGTVITFGSNIAVGADAAGAAANLAAYVNANSGSLGVTAVSGTTTLSTVLCVLVATANGTSGNSIAIAATSSAITRSSATLANGSANPGVPSGMMSGATTTSNDWLHRNNFGYALNALRVYRKLYAKGWIPGLTLV